MHEEKTDHFGGTFRNAMFAFAGASLLASIALKAAGNEGNALFVGQWVPTALIIGMWTKLVTDEPRLAS